MDTLLAAMEGVVEDLYGHVHRVSAVASAIGRYMDLDELDIDRLTTVGVLHDVGKVHVDPTILAKPGPLEGEELVRMRRHPEFGFAMTVDLFDRGVSQAILHHHERFDGSGYPYGLARHEIPLLARIVLVADAFDAITSHRAYHPALPLE
ncbi:MAG TPA: HD domain-containing phosphohydrolase [Acidimicrobiia bacterium]|nr:HD domain-containing phosphohydrolase [Acidimicrobiia bacterium]